MLFELLKHEVQILLVDMQSDNNSQAKIETFIEI